MADIVPAEMTPVDSSNIKAMGYNAETKVLTVQFHSGGVYHYEDVDQKHHDEMMSGNTRDSVGAYFHEHIKSRHKWKKAE